MPFIDSIRFMLGSRKQQTPPLHGQYAKAVFKITQGAYIPDVDAFIQFFNRVGNPPAYTFPAVLFPQVNETV